MKPNVPMTYEGDGSTTNFYLPHDISGHEQVFQNGILLTPGSDYTMPHRNTIQVKVAPARGDVMRVFELAAT